MKTFIPLLLFLLLSQQCLIACGSFDSWSDSANIVGAWHLTEGAGTTSVDYATGTRPINAFSGTVSWVTGIVGKALQMGGSNSDGANTTQETGYWNLRDGYTVAIWARVDNPKGAGGCNNHHGVDDCGTFITFGNTGGVAVPFFFGMSSDGNLFLDNGLNAGTWVDLMPSSFTIGSVHYSSATDAIVKGVWHYYVVTGSVSIPGVTAGTVTFYMDGSTVAIWPDAANATICGDCASKAMSMSLGRGTQGIGGCGCTVAEPVVRNRPRTAAEVQRDYANYVRDCQDDEGQPFR